MSVKFQALHFAIYSPNFHVESCYQSLNLGLIRDAMRAVLDRGVYQEFVNDVRREIHINFMIQEASTE